MDFFHRDLRPDTRTARACQFCKRLDPGFGERNPLDQLVQGQDTAAGHISEEGHLRHRMLELMRRMPPAPIKHVHPAA